MSEPYVIRRGDDTYTWYAVSDGWLCAGGEYALHVWPYGEEWLYRSDVGRKWTVGVHNELMGAMESAVSLVGRLRSDE